jgi:hypothetical protein
MTATKRITKAEQTRVERDEARAELRAMLNPGDTVNVIQRHVSQSGMMRKLSLFVGDVNVTNLAARAMGEKVDTSGYHNTIKVNGCGMDMHFATVYNLARALWPNGHPCTGHDSWDTKIVRGRKINRCPSNDHNNGMREYDTATIHSDGGYALKHRTL